MPILVGEDNPLSSGPEYALYPRPAGSAGHRLAFKILGAPTASHYLRMFPIRYNLCTGRWDLKEAQRRAMGLTYLYWPNPKILLGKKVCDAFDTVYRPFSQEWHLSALGKGPVLVLPHPSGRCREWNRRGSYARARRVFEAFIKDARSAP